MSPHLLLRVLGLLLAVGLAGPGTARADESGEITRMFADGQSMEALARIDRAIAAQPRDPKLQFQKAVMLGELKRTDEAAEIYTQLTIDHAELPEPYNNLAVIHAARGDLDQARAMLEGALRAQPGYAAAHQNLGDVYVQLAQRAYTQALQADPSNRDIAPKLVQLRELVTPVADAPH